MNFTDNRVKFKQISFHFMSCPAFLHLFRIMSTIRVVLNPDEGTLEIRKVQMTLINTDHTIYEALNVC